ncbi:MAG: hypothetical protein K2Q34_05490 [Alphaproteobacteria bacterium]|nr:hypothetical protein [Alphaproteobacteria bacterium]
MKKNYSLVLLSLLATTTISLAAETEGLDPEEKKRNRSLLSKPPLATEVAIPDDEAARGNKKSKSSRESISALKDALAGTGEEGDGSYSLSVLPTVLMKETVTKFDDQIMKEARDVLTAMLGEANASTQDDICEILSFARREDISYDDEKPSAAGLKAALSALSTLSEQENYIETVFGSFLVQNPHLIGLEPSPKDDTAGGSGYSSQLDERYEDPEDPNYGFQADDGLEWEEEDPEDSVYGVRANNGAEAGNEDGEDDDDDRLGYVDYGSEDEEGSGDDDEDED